MATDLRDTALNPNMPMRRDQLAQMTATPRSPRLGFLADAMMALKEFANRVQVPAGVPLLGGEGVGSLLLGKAPEELVEMSYGNMPMRINPYAGQTASFVPEMKPGRGAQVADLLSLAPTPGGARAAAGLAGMADMGGMERALIGYHGTPARFAPEEGAPLGRFRSEKIGSGEGSQAFGYGLYFAENPKTAKEYQFMARSPARRQGGLNQEGEQQKVIDSLIKLTANQFTDGDVNKLSKLIDERPLLFRYPEEMKKRISEYKDNQPPGFLYTVDIPDDMIGKMLDMDAPIEKAGQQVVDYFKSLGAYKPGKPLTEHMAIDKFMAEDLRRMGIPGLRYLDLGTRGQVEGTRNIVVFPGEESKVKILSRE